MNIYQEEILEHYHNPSNNGKIEGATHSDCALNPTCGDKICIDMIIKNDVIQNIKFSGEGCAISQAAASMLTEELLGKPVKTLTDMGKDDILKMLEIELSMNRLKCGLLALETSHKALKNEVTASKK